MIITMYIPPNPGQARARLRTYHGNRLSLDLDNITGQNTVIQLAETAFGGSIRLVRAGILDTPFGRFGWNIPLTLSEAAADALEQFTDRQLP